MPSTETRIGVDAGAERERGENGELVGGVEAADVEGRVGLGVAEFLRLGEADAERQPLLLHARENVIAGAVEDAGDAPDRVAGEPLAQGLDDRHAAADRRLEGERDAVILGERASSTPCAASIALLAVTTGKPRDNAARTAS